MNGKLIPSIAAIVIAGILLMIVRQIKTNTHDISELRHQLQQLMETSPQN